MLLQLFVLQTFHVAGMHQSLSLAMPV